MCFRRRKASMRPYVGFETTAKRRPAPIGVVQSEQRRPFIVTRRFHRLCYNRIAAIGADKTKAKKTTDNFRMNTSRQGLPKSYNFV